jgi:hypothetical protein
MNQIQYNELETLNHHISSEQKKNIQRIIEIEQLKESLAIAKAGIVEAIEKERMTSSIKVFTHEGIRDATTTIRFAEAEKQTIEKIRDMKRQRLLANIEIQTILRTFATLSTLYGSNPPQEPPEEQDNNQVLEDH